MADRYNLRGLDDLDNNAYTTLPGTASSEFVTHNMTPLKSQLAPGREMPGCHPTRWIYEFVHNDFTTCDLVERAKRVTLDVPYPWQHQHTLMVNGKQSVLTSSTRLISSVCADCHFHFVIKLAWDESQEACLCRPKAAEWPPQDSSFPWHHLVWAGSDSDSNIRADHSKYYPLLARENFVCSAPPCTFQITLEVSQPRMTALWINLLQDREAILEILWVAKESDPERYELATEEWADQAPMNLNTYLKNILEVSDTRNVRSISKRNKRFAVLFGQRCAPIFEGLEWVDKPDIVNGVDEGVVTPSAPAPPTGPKGATELNTYRAYLEDVRSELQCILMKKSLEDSSTGGAPRYQDTILPLLHSELVAQEVFDLGDNVLTNIERYKLLGVVPGQKKEIVANAYRRQWDLLPSKRKELIDALAGIANDLNDEAISNFAATQSSIFESQLQTQSTSDDDGLVSQALTFLGLQPPNKYKADALVQAFRQKLAKDPDSAGTARSMLQLIARASTDDAYQATLLLEAEAKMSLGTSKVVLGIVGSSGFGPDTLDAARAKVEASQSKEAKATYLDAMEAIAEHTNSSDLKLTINEMRQKHGIAIPEGGATTSYSTPFVNYELPVGLENIGNTCYLNSLLQYLFTVKPIRDIALNYESFKLPLDDESIKARLLGGNKMQMDRGEAVVAQAFAQELSELFGNLQTSDKVATRPSQRLANAVLLSTHTLLKDPKPVETTTPAKPPPLPARPSPLPPMAMQDPELVEAMDKHLESVQETKGAGTQTPQKLSPDAMQEPELADAVDKHYKSIQEAETISNVSSQTLVDEPDEDSDRSYEKIENSSASTDAQTNDSGIEVKASELGSEDAANLSKESEAPVLIELDAPQNASDQNVDVKMTDVEETQAIDRKVLSALEYQKRSSGTDQQDVEEVMGSILNRLQAAIRPVTVDAATGIQLENIMETFFVTTINYTKKFDENTYQQEVSFDRSITAFPAPEGPCSLYEALGRNFDQQIIEESKLSRYTAIKTLPPVLHVLIQRSQSMGSKNGNPVVIPETLYLDRYMDAEHDSPEFRTRVKNWMIANRIADVKAQQAKLQSSNIGSCDLTQEAKNDGERSVSGSAARKDWSFDGSFDDDYLWVDSPAKHDEDPVPLVPFTEIQEAEAEGRRLIDEELVYRQEALDEHFSGLKNIPYRLHAVICHRGHLMSGHYWVWIHDFEEGVWRKYNDSNVDTNRNTDEVLKSLSTSGEPYFLCYVRDSDKDDYVNVPKRQVPIAVPDPEQAPSTDADGDVVIANDEPAPEQKAEGENDESPLYSGRLAK